MEKTFEIQADKSIRVYLDALFYVELLDWEISAAARTMRFFLERKGSFTQRDLISCPPFTEEQLLKAESMIDYTQSLGLISKDASGNYRAECWIDDDVLFGEAA